jgi:hypothetical protein
MFTRHASPSSTLALAMWSAGFFITSCAVMHKVDRHASLDATVLADSRGGNQHRGLDQLKCNDYAVSPCGLPGLPCTACSQNTFTGTDHSTTGSGFNSVPGTTPCGAATTGTCTEDLVCDTSRGTPAGSCTINYLMVPQMESPSP